MLEWLKNYLSWHFIAVSIGIIAAVACIVRDRIITNRLKTGKKKKK